MLTIFRTNGRAILTAALCAGIFTASPLVCAQNNLDTLTHWPLERPPHLQDPDFQWRATPAIFKQNFSTICNDDFNNLKNDTIDAVENPQIDPHVMPSQTSTAPWAKKHDKKEEQKQEEKKQWQQGASKQSICHYHTHGQQNGPSPIEGRTFSDHHDFLYDISLDTSSNPLSSAFPDLLHNPLFNPRLGSRSSVPQPLVLLLLQNPRMTAPCAFWCVKEPLDRTCENPQGSFQGHPKALSWDNIIDPNMDPNVNLQADLNVTPGLTSCIMPDSANITAATANAATRSAAAADRPSDPASAPPMDFSHTVEHHHLSKAIVAIDISNNKTEKLYARGSGFFVYRDETGAYLVTNYHVIQRFLKGPHRMTLTVTLGHGQKYHGRVVGFDPLTDLALIMIQPEAEDTDSVRTLQWGDSQGARLGQWVLAASAMGSGDLLVTNGILACKATNENKDRRRIAPGLDEFLQTTACISPGSSGGPLLNPQGQVIGVISLFFQEGALSAAIPSNYAQKVIQTLLGGQSIKRGCLGLTVSTLNSAAAAELGAANARVIVETVDPHYSTRYYVCPGDLLLEIDGMPIDSPTHLQSIIRQKIPGDVVHLKIFRTDSLGQKIIAAAVTLAEIPRQYQGLSHNESIDFAVNFLNLTLAPAKTEMGCADPHNTLGIDPGALVIKVGPLSPFFEHIQEGDIIFQINNTRINNPQQLLEAFIQKLRDQKGVSQIVFKILRPNVRQGASSGQRRAPSGNQSQNQESDDSKYQFICRFWKLPQQRQGLLAHLEEALEKYINPDSAKGSDEGSDDESNKEPDATVNAEPSKGDSTKVSSKVFPKDSAKAPTKEFDKAPTKTIKEKKGSQRIFSLSRVEKRGKTNGSKEKRDLRKGC